jgi:linoleoyl-CoA desaturase
MRDIYSAATIFCGHIGEETAAYPEGDKASSRGAWYARQVEATNDFSVPYALSVLCGGLDLQIEHHLFPTLPPQRLREIAPEVREICARHGVTYRTDSWGRTLRRALAWVGELGRRGGARAILEEV